LFRLGLYNHNNRFEYTGARGVIRRMMNPEFSQLLEVERKRDGKRLTYPSVLWLKRLGIVGKTTYHGICAKQVPTIPKVSAPKE